MRMLYMYIYYVHIQDIYAHKRIRIHLQWLHKCGLILWSTRLKLNHVASSQKRWMVIKIKSNKFFFYFSCAMTHRNIYSHTDTFRLDLLYILCNV